MYIAVAADGIDLKSKVSDNFASCKYLLIVNMDKMEIGAIENSGDPQGEALAYKLVDHNCEAIITGKLNSEAFEIIANNCITRYYGHGYSVKEALALMDRYELKLIRNVQGTDECESQHTVHSCDEAD
jgi:predicted Fe-Mo cluster-binding NifX family protein